MKKYFSLFALLALVVSLLTPTSAFAAENVRSEISDFNSQVINDEIEYEEGKAIVLQNLNVLDNGMVILTQELTETENDVYQFRSYPEREKTKVFSHTIYDTNGIVMAVLYTTVTGIYSQADNEAFLTNISGYFTGEFASALSYGSSISGDTGRLDIFWYGFYMDSLSYRIYTNGNIQNI